MIDKIKKSLEQDRIYHHRRMDTLDKVDIEKRDFGMISLHAYKLSVILEYIALIEELENEM